MNSMLENGPWLILNVPLILRKWSPDANIMKEDMCNVFGWVKFHNILNTAFTKDGLSVNTTKLGATLMLNSYKTDMCLDSCGRSSYARAMIELQVDVELEDTLVMDIPKFKGGGYSRSTVCAEYEWKPPRCLTCKGKDHGEYILQSIDEGPFKMGRCRDDIASSTDDPYLGPKQDRVVAYLSQAEKDRLRADIRATNILLQGLPRDI
nr:hypothetical protein [Tanacetum cinerariifolium]